MNRSEHEQLQKLLKKYLKGECTPEEARQIQSWYDTLDRDNVEPKMEEAEQSNLKQQMWMGIRNRMEEAEVNPAFSQQNEPKGSVIRLLWQLGIAAMVLLTIGWVYWNTKAVRQHTPVQANAFIEKVNRTDHATSYQLADGSIVWLKPHSLLRYPNQFRNEAREVYLEGEAFFEVAHNAKKPFRVYSNQLVVRVLGTSFTVKAFRRDSTAEVSVRTGRVSVYSVPLEKYPTETGFSSDQAIAEAEKSSTLLTPNQKAIFYAAAQRLVTDEVKQADYWEKEEAQHQFNFTNAPLDEVMGMLEETYGVSIELENDALKNCTLTATMGNQSLETKLEMICKSIGATFEQSESTIYIKGKGCE